MLGQVLIGVSSALKKLSEENQRKAVKDHRLISFYFTHKAHQQEAGLDLVAAGISMCFFILPAFQNSTPLSLSEVRGENLHN